MKIMSTPYLSKSETSHLYNGVILKKNCDSELFLKVKVLDEDTEETIRPKRGPSDRLENSNFKGIWINLTA